ncbi:MAG: bifunctional ornithine acetyltransferase/N-acetylglutamate synthase, partial [Pseudomonadota bacterium]
KADAEVNRDLISVSVGGVQVAKNGARAPSYNEAIASAACSGRDISVDVALGLADGQSRVWTCDLSHAYVEINGAYRT